jgi:hypothetical protein
MSVPSRASARSWPGASPPVCDGTGHRHLRAGPVVNKDQRDDSRNATTRGACGIGAYDTGGA